MPSYTELAEATGISRATIARVLNGQRDITLTYLQSRECPGIHAGGESRAVRAEGVGAPPRSSRPVLVLDVAGYDVEGGSARGCREV